MDKLIIIHFQLRIKTIKVLNQTAVSMAVAVTSTIIKEIMEVEVEVTKAATSLPIKISFKVAEVAITRETSEAEEANGTMEATLIATLVATIKEEEATLTKINKMTIMVSVVAKARMAMAIREEAVTSTEMEVEASIKATDGITEAVEEATSTISKEEEEISSSVATISRTPCMMRTSAK